MFSVRTDRKTPPEVRAAVTPRTQADKPIGEWNHFDISVRGKTVNVVLNGTTVIPDAVVPTLPDRGRLAFQHHGGKNKDGAWTRTAQSGSVQEYLHQRITLINAGPAAPRRH